MHNWQLRTELLIGKENIELLGSKHVLIVGLGGVGGACAEMIARSGIGKLTLVDADVVEASNKNRQLPALSSTDGMSKVEVMAQRLTDINPQISIHQEKIFIDPENIYPLLEKYNPDYVLDCIDTLSPKVELIIACTQKNIPFASALGAGGMLDPLDIRIDDLFKSRHCRLAFYVRKRLKRRGFKPSFPVVYSYEKADLSKVILNPKGSTKRSTIGTISYMPNLFGCTLASVAIRQLLNIEIIYSSDRIEKK